MKSGEELNQRMNRVRKKLWINLIDNWFAPILLVILIRSFYVNDAIALAIAGVIPVLRTVMLSFLSAAAVPTGLA